jgi:hypothetical protein
MNIEPKPQRLLSKITTKLPNPAIASSNIAVNKFINNPLRRFPIVKNSCSCDF